MNSEQRGHRPHLGFDERVTSKIVSAAELVSRIGTMPRSQVVVMAHGTFDLVHPGHLRHLAFAKSQGEKLVVSITTDAHVMKANMRPYVPEELRALNLAALELVDFVVVDANAEPISLIERVQPNIFIKGYEYGQRELPAKTKREKEAVESYGGRIVFSPGDFVLSSSMLIENDPPDLGLEKLLTLLDVEGLTFSDLRRSLDGANDLELTIMGDLIVDSITTVSVIGGHRKTPTPSVRVEGRERFVGGAGIVAKHMAAAGARVRFLTLVGDDDLGRYAMQDLRNSGIDVEAMVDPSRPTTLKDAVVADGYRLLRLDDVDNKTIDASTQKFFQDALAQHPGHAVVFSDFRHGIFNKATIPGFLEACPTGLFKVADSQVASRWGNILDFRGCDLITPNEQEVRFALGDQDTVIRPLGSHLYETAGCGILMLKLGAHGMITFRDPAVESHKRSFFSIDAITRAPVLDAVGSGDALLAYATVAQLLTGNEVIASIIGTIAAGLACEREGNVQIRPVSVLQRLDELEKAASYA